MAIANLPGGATVGSPTFGGFVGFRGVYSPGENIPAGRTAANGQNPVLVTKARSFVGGRDVTRTVRYRMGTSYSGSVETPYFTVPAKTTAQTNSSPTAYQNFGSGAIFEGGTTVRFYIENNGVDNFIRFGRTIGQGTVVPFNGSTTYSFSGDQGGLCGDYEYFYVPGAPSINGIGSDGSTTSLSWAAGDMGSASDINGYNIRYSTDSGMSGASTIGVGNVSSHSIGGLSRGITWYFQVAAKNSVSDAAGTTSQWSGVQAVFVPAEQVIDPDPDPTPDPEDPPVDPGEPTETVPDVVGLTQQQATLALQAVGFVVSVLTTTGGATSANDGKVHIQTPGGLSLANVGSTVFITVFDWELEGGTGTAPTTPTGDTDGWFRIGITNGVQRVLSRVAVEGVSGLSLTVSGVSTAVGGTYIANSVGISRNLPTIVGATYTISGFVKENSDKLVSKYRFAVEGIGQGGIVTASVVDQEIPSYTFVATLAMHKIQILVADNYTTTATGTVEDVAFHNIEVTQGAVETPYSLQDNRAFDSLASHFDLATQSVGASWWVDKTNKTNFAFSFESADVVATFSDVEGYGNLNYGDIKVGLETKKVVNDIVLTNIGVAANPDTPEDDNELETKYGVVNPASISDWGTRRMALTTNLYTEPVARNILWNPSFNQNTDNWFKYDLEDDHWTQKRVRTTQLGTGATNELWSGVTNPGNGYYCSSFTIEKNASTYSVAVGQDGAEYDLDDIRMHGFEVKPNTSYAGTMYIAAGNGASQAGNTSSIWIRWFDARGQIISTSSTVVTYGQLLSGEWTRMAVVAVSPANARYAQLRARLNMQHNSIGRTYYMANAQLEEGLSASAFFDGSKADNDTYLYKWEGDPNRSASRQMINILDNRGAEIIAEFGTPRVQVSALKWNAQQDITKATRLDIGSKINIEWKNTTNSYRIVGLKHDITPETWMMDIEVELV